MANGLDFEFILLTLCQSSILMMKILFLLTVILGWVSPHISHAQSEWTAKDRKMFADVCRKVILSESRHKDSLVVIIFESVFTCYRLKMEHKYPKRKDFIAKGKNEVQKIVKDKIEDNFKVCLQELAKDSTAKIGWNKKALEFIFYDCLKHINKYPSVTVKAEGGVCSCVVKKYPETYPNMYYFYHNFVFNSKMPDTDNNFLEECIKQHSYFKKQK